MIIIGLVTTQSFALSSAFGQSIKERYELDERCGHRAEQYFSKNYPNAIDKENNVTFFYSYRNHYNPRLNKCIIYIATKALLSGKGQHEEVHTLDLLDLNENNSLGSFIGSPTDGRPATVCEVNERRCSTEAEWLELIKKYMED